MASPRADAPEWRRLAARVRTVALREGFDLDETAAEIMRVARMCPMSNDPGPSWDDGVGFERHIPWAALAWLKAHDEG